MQRTTYRNKQNNTKHNLSLGLHGHHDNSQSKFPDFLKQKIWPIRFVYFFSMATAPGVDERRNSWLVCNGDQAVLNIITYKKNTCSMIFCIFYENHRYQVIFLFYIYYRTYWFSVTFLILIFCFGTGQIRNLREISV